MAVRTLTEAEQKQLLHVTLSHIHGLRDHIIILMALKTGLRSAEILALNVGDVFASDGTVKGGVVLPFFKGKSKIRKSDPMLQSVGIVHDGLRDKLAKLYRQKKAAGHDMTPGAPLFVRRHGGGRKAGRLERDGRLTTKALRDAFTAWQMALGWDRDKTRFFRFHDLRHTAITRYATVTSASNSLAGLQATSRFARHKSMKTTEIYLHGTEEEYMQALRRM